MTLAEYITANLRKPFAWGSNDCVLFAVGWLKIATGADFLAEYPKWSGERAALRLMKRIGGLEAQLDKHLVRIHPNLAQDGAIALHNGSMCLFSGPHIVGPGPDGLTFIDRTKAECAWRY